MNWNSELLPHNGQVVVGFYDDGENSWVQRCRYDEINRKWYGVGGATPDEETGAPDYWAEQPPLKKVWFCPNLYDDILISETDETRDVILGAGLKFDADISGSECQIPMDFYDGVARAKNCMLEMTYPTVAEVNASPQMQEEIRNYTGREDINQFDICLKYGVVRKIQVDMKCMYCGTPLIFTGNVGCNEHGDYKDSDPATISYFDCPKCGRSYEVWEPNEEDRNTKFNDYWNKEL